DAQTRLNGSYDPTDYPADLTALYEVTWSYPSIEPDSNLPADVADQQRAQLDRELEAVAQRAELALLEEFQDLSAHLAERLTPDADGNSNAFPPNTPLNLHNFPHNAHPR